MTTSTAYLAKYRPTLAVVLNHLRRQAPDAKAVWTVRPRIITYPTGVSGWHGEFIASGAGFRTRRMFVKSDEYGRRIY